MDDSQDLLEFVVTVHFPESAVDDSMEETSQQQFTIEASDIETALKYAQQHIRKMQFESEDSRWEDAEILSIDRRS